MASNFPGDRSHGDDSNVIRLNASSVMFCAESHCESISFNTCDAQGQTAPHLSIRHAMSVGVKMSF